MRKIVYFIILLVVLTAGTAVGLKQIKPDSRPTTTDEAFENILRDLTTITAAPHSAGSPENLMVRDMITSRAQALGLTVRVLPFKVDFLDLNNILIKVNGTDPHGTAMFVSHYDSVSTAPGAADDGLAVACMLELMARMSAKPPANDVYFLYTDGEEKGLLGAADFVRTQPSYADSVDVLFNFEARGNAGALLMFETSAGDYRLVQHFSGSVPQPVTLSIATAIYELMPNGTDFSEFKNAGYEGLNFAMIEGDETYHQPSDNIENLNKDTAWQYYQTMIALGEHFGQADLTAIRHTQDALYFPLPLIGIVVLPGWFGRILGMVPFILALLLIVFTVRNKNSRPAGKALRIFGLLLMGILPAAVTLFFFAGSYLFSVPALLFLLTDLLFGEGIGRRGWAGAVMLPATVFVCALLFVPITFLVQVALKMWFASALFALLPLMPAILYVVKIVRRLDWVVSNGTE